VQPKAKRDQRPGDGLLPGGPKNCMRTRNAGGRTCDVCGTAPLVVHIPLHQHGVCCATCCPCCGDRQAAAGPSTGAPVSHPRAPAFG
jgi:hypothetical protein